MHTRNLMILATSAALLACTDATTAPADRVPLQLIGFEIPEMTRRGDTLRVGVHAVLRCGLVPSKELQMERGRITLRAWALRQDIERPCISIHPGTAQIDLLIPPQYVGDEETVLVFRQPRGADSVLVVPNAPVAARAP